LISTALYQTQRPAIKHKRTVQQQAFCTPTMRKYVGSRAGEQSAFRRGVRSFNSNHVTGINTRHDTSMIHPHCHDSRHVTATSSVNPNTVTTREIFPTKFQANYSAGKQNFLFSAFTSLNLRTTEIRLRHCSNRVYQRTIND